MILSRESNFPIWTIIARVIIVVLVPLILLLTSLRLLLTDAFIHIEYRLPAFPEDSYGFRLEDRLRWAPIALDYLLNDEDIDFLGNLEFDGGGEVFNQRELRHMVDVKQLTQLVFGVWAGGLACLILLGVLLYVNGYREILWRSIRTGARIIFWFLVVLSITLVISFSFVFVGFHLIFFEGDTWLFLYSDTLIRLFPTRFWRDVFIFIIVLTLGMTGLTHLISSRQLKKVTEM